MVNDEFDYVTAVIWRKKITADLILSALVAKNKHFDVEEN